MQNHIPKIQLVACAKDEAAYLPEWIFYHLDIGFSSIKIYVNNTTDNSLIVLDKIIEHYPQVSYVVADELIKNPPEEYQEKTNENFYKTNKIQSSIYTDALCNRDINLIDHIAFLDVDEFFVLQKPLSEIFSADISAATPQRFKWLLLCGDNEEFCSLIKCTKGFVDDSFKTVIPNRDIDIRAEDPHRFSIEGGIGNINDGALIFHRVLRSKKEYLYLLSNATFAHDTLTSGFKQNRRGWVDKGMNINLFMPFISEDYEQNLSRFIDLCQIDLEIQIAKNRVLTKYDLIIESLTRINQQNIDLTRSLGGAGVSHINIFKTLMFTFFWGVLRVISPRLVLSHETIKEALLAKIKCNKKPD